MVRKNKNKLKWQQYRQNAGKIEVKLRDNVDTPLYKSEVFINNVRELASLISDLEDRGVPIKKAVRMAKSMSDDYWEL